MPYGRHKKDSETGNLRDLHDTQPSRSYYIQVRDDGLRSPPKLLFWGLILFFLLVVCGTVGVIYGFREVLRPAQQQRVIDQLPFMSVLRNPTPFGGVFPTIVSAADTDNALSLLDMPLDFASPTALHEGAIVSVATQTTPPPLVPAILTPTVASPAITTAVEPADTATALPPTLVPTDVPPPNDDVESATDESASAVGEDLRYSPPTADLE